MKNQNGADEAMRHKMLRIAEKRNERLEGGLPWRLLDLFLTLAAVAVFALALRGGILEPVRVDGTSMLDTLHHNDYMFVEKLTYAVSKPKAGDIVICYYPDEYYEVKDLAYRTRVKRVVATAGDTVQTIDGALYVNGKAVSEPYLSLTRQRTTGIETPITLGEDEIFVLGDNRPGSNDSRNALVGPIPLCRVVGKAHFVIFPPSRWHGV